MVRLPSPYRRTLAQAQEVPPRPKPFIESPLVNLLTSALGAGAAFSGAVSIKAPGWKYAFFGTGILLAVRAADEIYNIVTKQ